MRHAVATILVLCCAACDSPVAPAFEQPVSPETPGTGGPTTLGAPAAVITQIRDGLTGAMVDPARVHGSIVVVVAYDSHPGQRVGILRVMLRGEPICAHAISSQTPFSYWCAFDTRRFPNGAAPIRAEAFRPDGVIVATGGGSIVLENQAQ